MFREFFRGSMLHALGGASLAILSCQSASRSPSVDTVPLAHAGEVGAQELYVKVRGVNVEVSRSCPGVELSGDLPEPFALVRDSADALDRLVRHSASFMSSADAASFKGVIAERRAVEGAARLMCSLSREGGRVDPEAASGSSLWQCDGPRGWKFSFYPSGSAWSERWEFFPVDESASILVSSKVPPGEGAFDPFVKDLGEFIVLGNLRESWGCPVDPELACWLGSSGLMACDLPPGMEEVACTLEEIDGWLGVYERKRKQLVLVPVAGRRLPEVHVESDVARVDCG